MLNNPKSRCFSVYHSFPPVSTRLPFVSTRFYSFSTRLLLVCIRLQSFTTRLHSSHLLEPSSMNLLLIYRSLIKVLLFISFIIPPILDITHSVHYHIRINHYIVYYFKRVSNLKDIQPHRDN